MATEQTATAGEAKPAEPAQAARTAASRTARQRAPWWLGHHPSLAVGALLLVIGELVAYRAFGLMWWAVGNAVLAALVFGVGLAWRRKGKPTGGLLDRLLPASRRGARSPRGRRGSSVGPGRAFGGSRSGGAGSRAPGLFGRSTGASRSGGGAGGGRGLLGRLTGRGRSSSGAAGRSGAGPATGARRGLLGRIRSGRQAKVGSTAGGGGASGKTGRGWRLPFTGGRSAGRAGDASGGGSRVGGKASRLRRAFAGRSGAGSRPGGSTRKTGGAHAPDGGAIRKAGGKSGPSKFNPLAWKSWRPGDVGKAPANRKKADGDQSKPNPGATGPQRPQPQAGGTDEQAARPTPRPQPAPPVPVPTAPRTAPGRSTTMPIHHNDDASLQAWGRNLAHIGPALEEIAKGHDRHIEEGKLATAALKKMANAADTELPASKVLVADLQGIADESARIDAEMEALAARRRQLIGRGESLAVTYKREHAMDEDRLNNPRTSRSAEKRADVTRAEQDT